MKRINLHKRNLFLIIFALLAAAFMACALSACSNESDEERILSEGYVHLVTYDGDGGDFDSVQTGLQDKMEVRVKDGSLTVKPGYKPSGVGSRDYVPVPTKTGYFVAGWQLVELDGDGNVVSARDWNFSSDKVTSDITIRALWKKEVTLNINAVIDGEVVNLRALSPMEQGQPFIGSLYNATGSGAYVLTPDNLNVNFSTVSVNDKDYTLLGFYWLDENDVRTDLTVENAVFSQTEEEMTIYADVIEGEYVMVTQDAVDRGLELEEDSMWYILEDVDFGMGYPKNSIEHYSAASWSALQSFSGSIIGNGHTVKGVWVKSEVTALNTRLTHSIFGEMSGRVEDVRFESVELTVFSLYSSPASSVTVSAALLATDIAAGAGFENVTLSDCSISVVNASTENAGQTITRFVCNIAQGGLWINAPAGDAGAVGEVSSEFKMDMDIRR